MSILPAPPVGKRVAAARIGVFWDAAFGFMAERASDVYAIDT